MLALDDVIMEGDLIRPAQDASVEITLDGMGDPVVLDGNQNWLATADTFTPTDNFPVDDAFASVDAIQAAILAGQDPTELLEPTAAGAPGAGGATGNEGADFVQLDRTADETTPEAGYETVGLISDTQEPTGESGVFLLDENEEIFPPPEDPVDPQPGGGNPGNDKPVGNSPWDGHTGGSGNTNPGNSPNHPGDDSEPNQPPGQGNRPGRGNEKSQEMEDGTLSLSDVLSDSNSHSEILSGRSEQAGFSGSSAEMSGVLEIDTSGLMNDLTNSGNTPSE